MHAASRRRWIIANVFAIAAFPASCFASVLISLLFTSSPVSPKPSLTSTLSKITNECGRAAKIMVTCRFFQNLEHRGEQEKKRDKQLEVHDLSLPIFFVFFSHRQ